MKTLRSLVSLFLLSLALSSIARGQYCGNPVNPPPPPPEKDPPQCSRRCPSCNASPCYAGTGMYVSNAVDLEVQTVGLPIRIDRSYMTARLVDGILGFGNTSSLQARLYYAVYLFAAPSTYRNVADVVLTDGKHYRFIEATPGQFTPPETRTDVLVRNGDGSFDLTLQRSLTVYHFLSDGSLSYIRDDYGNLTSYSYDGNGRLSRIADGSGSGRYVDVFWGADGRVSAVQDSSGRQVLYAYNANGSMASMTDAAGRMTTFSYVTGRFGTPLLSRVTDNWNRVITDVTYLSTDQVNTFTENGETWRMSYRYQSNLAKTAKYDSSNNLWVLTFGADIQITDRVAPDGSATHTLYTPEGWVQQQTDEAGVKSYYTYDSAGNLTSVTKDYQGTTAVRYDYTYDPNFPGKVTSITPKNPSTGAVNPDWQAWQYDYYQSGSTAPGALHHVYRVDSDGVTLETLATYEYDALGGVTRQTTASGAQTDYVYDSQGNLSTVTGSANNDGGTRPVKTYSNYDNAGRPRSVTDPNGKTTTYTYDALGRVLTVTLPPPSPGSLLNFTTTYSYDNFDSGTGLVFTNITDPNGKLTRLGYDQFGRLVKSIDAAGNTTTYAYTKDVLTSITDANNNATSYQYDTLKRLIKTTFPDSAFESYAYTADSLLRTKTDRKGQVLTYAYDAFKRLKTKTYPDTTSITYTYQGQKLTQVVDTYANPDETHSFTYDPSYRVASNTQGPRGTVSYTYTADDRVATMSITSGPTATYAYYPDGSLRTIDWSPVAGHFTWAYTLPGQYQSLTFPNGQQRSYGYDDQGRLLSLSNTLASTTLATYGYSYDVDNQTGQSTMLGQRTSMTATVPAQGLNAALSKYYYDPLYQLTRADYPAGSPFNGESHSWTYDAIGNRLTNTVNGSTQTYTYLKNGSNPLNGQRLSSDGVNAYTWDANGSNLARNGAPGNFTFGYDPNNRLAGISGAATATYTYDYYGRRASSTVNGTTTTYLYDGLNLLEEISGGATANYVFGPAIDQPLAQYRSGTLTYLSADALGTILVTNDAAGNATLSASVDAWGVARNETGTRLHPFTFTGRETGEAGLLFYRTRFYQSGTGRLAAEDAIRRHKIHPSSYAYAWNNPANLLDPLGLWPPNACTLVCTATLSFLICVPVGAATVECTGPWGGIACGLVMGEFCDWLCAGGPAPNPPAPMNPAAPMRPLPPLYPEPISSPSIPVPAPLTPPTPSPVPLPTPGSPGPPG